MLNKFEHISNTIGKRALLVLFYFFITIQCKACAIYVFKIKENFKCPLCEFLKANNVKNLFTVSISLQEMIPVIIIDDVKKEVSTNPYQNHTKAHNVEQCATVNLSIHLPQKLPYAPALEEYQYIFYERKLYLKFHQLKIGDVVFTTPIQHS